MTCDQFQQMVSAFIDDELNTEEVRSLFVHLGSCDACWTYYRRVERLHTELRRAPGPGDATAPEPVPLVRRNNVSYATVALGGYLAFVIGVLITLMLLPPKAEPTKPPFDEWFSPHYLSQPANHSPATTHSFPRRDQ